MSNQIAQEYTEKDFDETIDIIDKITTEKLEFSKSFIPIAISMFTSILVVLISIQMSSEKTIIAMVGISILFVTMLLFSLIFTQMPIDKFSYNILSKKKLKRVIDNFDICDFKTYRVPNNIFIEEIAKLSKNELTLNQILKITNIKQKINLFYYKQSCIFCAYLTCFLWLSVIIILICA